MVQSFFLFVLTAFALQTTTGLPPYPGPNFTHPRIHQSPDCLHLDGWHDIAGALTHKGLHHVFQGCPASGGWSHSTSVDLVHWTDRGRGLHQLNESYQGMHSYSPPCSGFVALDETDTPCAGFRQCSSDTGTTALNPAAHPWDVPLEIRCAQNSELTEWGRPEYLYPIYYYRSLPYDPVRPWQDYDGQWYSAWSSDGCNSTTKTKPCSAGGQLELLVSSTLHGPLAEWQQLEPMFTTNTTKSGALVYPGAINGEFVTSDFFGALSGDPDGGSTRVVLQNNPYPSFWVGRQANGSQFTPYWNVVGAVGRYDYGDFIMARTLGSYPNQVTAQGRKVLIGWITGDHTASQSLSRDLSLSNRYELLQHFVPELHTLRLSATATTTTTTNTESSASSMVFHAIGSLQLEVSASFSWSDNSILKRPFGVSVLNGTQRLVVDCTKDSPEAPGGCTVHVTGLGINYSGPLLPIKSKSVCISAIVDHQLVETIFNNRTAITSNISPPNEGSTHVHLFGVDQHGLQGDITTWELKAANNFGPQPIV